MIHRMLRYPADWEWHVLLQSRQLSQEGRELPSRKRQNKASQQPMTRPKRQEASNSEKQALEERHLQELRQQFPECAAWTVEARGRRANHISVDDIPGFGPLMTGTLMIQVSEDQSDIQPFHFWISKKRMITMHEDIRVPLRLQSGNHADKYAECDCAPEAFFIMISVILETFHDGLDGFERRLGKLERTMQNANRTSLLDSIFERRYDLLHWSHLFIPIRELHGAAKEVFEQDLQEKEAYTRITHKLERIELLLKHYALEIDTLISMNDAISSFRGNDIMKTLTIFTVVFLPASIIGSLLGTNFDWLPGTENRWGFAIMLAGIAVITIGVYLWLWKKGWTGDLLLKHSKSVGAQKSSKQNRSSRNKRNPVAESRKEQLVVQAHETAFDSAVQKRSRRRR
ncbi:magnesium transporter CorA family protein [Paenibacillus sp. HB172176]|uniref:magnesium transporter CorA family protein n=1 Tax=Paenibacillus sp. HB172176 TaxID=2493690 RepID=UPI0014388D11|nr:magnesium transporter CorA family protein [Paenibacillus sp. HB172176]